VDTEAESALRERILVRVFRHLWPGDGGGVYFGYVAPYGYAYDPGYGYYPGYADAPVYYGPGPAPQGCTEGSYDRHGNWVPSPNCYSDQQQYAPPQQNYNPNQQQYQSPQQNYDPNQRQYPQPQQNYDPNQRQYPQRQQNYDPITKRSKSNI